MCVPAQFTESTYNATVLQASYSTHIQEHYDGDSNERVAK